MATKSAQRHAGPGGSRLVGQRIPRVEDAPLLTGRAQFVDDIERAGMLHLAFARSPFAHARIGSLDASAAGDCEGVVDVVPGAELDLGPLETSIENPDAYSPPRPYLASDVVRFAGEPVVAVAAEDRYKAEDALEAIEIEYEPLDVVHDVSAAIAPDAPPLHDHGSNVIFELNVDSTGVDEAFASAAAVVEREFINPRYSAVPLETRGVLATWDGDELTIWASAQSPHRLATLVMQVLRLSAGQVRVVVPDVGGGFGQKAHHYPEELLVAWFALRLGRPVKWIEDRAENLLASSHARGQTLRVAAAADADGRIVAMRAESLCDQGAYGVFPHGHLLEALGTPVMIPGPYRVPAYRARARTVATNKCPSGAYRGVGLPVAALVHERLMDMLAGELDIDRAEIRRRNLLTADELPHTTLTGQRYDSGDYPRALEVALDAIGYRSFPEEQAAARRKGRLLGLGLCCYVEYTGINQFVFHRRGMVEIPGFDGAYIELGVDGRARVWTTLPTNGQGLTTTFAQLVAETIGLEFVAVSVEAPDSSVGQLHGTGTYASRSAIAGGGAIKGAASKLRERLLEDGAARLEVGARDLEVAGGAVRVVGAPERGVPIGELVGANAERFRLSEHYDPPAVSYPYATHACRLEVDPETGGIEFDSYVIVEDCGTLINPLIVEGQTHGATAQGVGGAVYESIAYDDAGQLQNASLMDYLVPTASDVPELRVTHLEIPAPDTAYGAKGVGEGGTLGPPAAIANAVSDALDVEMNELLLSPERVRLAARSALA